MKNSAIEKIGDRHHAQLSDGDTPQDRATDSDGEADEPTIVETSLSQQPSVSRAKADGSEDISNKPTQYGQDEDSPAVQPGIERPDDDGTLIEQDRAELPPTDPIVEDTLLFDTADPNGKTDVAATDYFEANDTGDSTVVESLLHQSDSIPTDMEVGDDETLPPPASDFAANAAVEASDRDDIDATVIEPAEAALDSQADVPTIIDSLTSEPSDRNRLAKNGDAVEFSSAVTDPSPDSETSQPPASSEPGQAVQPPIDGTIVLEKPGATAYFDQENVSISERERNRDGTSSAATGAADDWPSQLPESAKRGGRISSGETSDRFRLIENFAHGGMGNIWRAEDERIRREVAYKELLPEILNNREMVERFLEEAQVTGQLEHPGIVPVYELGRDSKGAPFYAMKLVHGTTMRDAIKTFHALPADDGIRHLAFVKLLRNFIDVCHAIAFAHERGVLHRDLKPANVMLGDFGETMVLDWGLAKLIDPLESTAADEATIGSLSQSELTTSGGATRSDETMPGTHAHDPSHSGSQSAMTVDSMLGTSGHSTRHSVKTDVRSRGTETLAGVILGTPHYMSPEQAQMRNSELDARSDIYSLGAILYEILTGERPVEKNRLRKMLKQIVDGRIIPPRQHLSSIPKPIEAVCMKALARRRKNRYQTAHQLVADIEAFLIDEPVSVYEEPVQVRLKRWRRKHRTLVSSCVVAALMAVVVFTAWRRVENNRVAKSRTQVESKLAEATQAIETKEFPRASSLLSEAQGNVDSNEALSDMKPAIAAVESAVKAGVAATEVKRRAESQLQIERTLANARKLHEVNNDLGAALAAYAQAIALLGREPSLKALLAEAREEQQIVDAAIKHEKSKQAALAEFQQFEQDVDDARIYGSLINGDLVDVDLRKAQEFAKSALAKYELEGPNPPFETHANIVRRATRSGS